MFASGKTAAVASAANYIEDVFSTYLVTGDGTAPAVNNGIDLSTKGGLVWTKKRSAAGSHSLFDTARGANLRLISNDTAAQDSVNLSFTTTGFSNYTFDSGVTYASWTFRKQPKFFDVVTWTGNGGASQTISHNLGSAPGCIIAKGTSTVDNWWVYHRSASGTPLQSYLRLNNTSAAATGGSDVWGATSTTITVDSSLSLNTSGQTYVAYLFAHNAGGFGLTGTDNVISCGSFTSDALGQASVTLNYEPQWVIIKRTDGTSNWTMLDNMRGWAVTSSGDAALQANTSNAETSATEWGYPTATGFSVNEPNGSATYIYIAIRRGPMKVPTSGTSVFKAITRTGTGAAVTVTGAGFAPDLVATACRDFNGFGYYDKLRGALKALRPSQTSAEATYTTTLTGFTNTGYTAGSNSDGFGEINGNTDPYVNHMFARAPSFFDEVCYTGTGTGSRAVTHNLGVAPEMVIVKQRTGTPDHSWWVLTTAVPLLNILNSTEAANNSGTPANLFGDSTYNNYIAPTATTVTLSPSDEVNKSGNTYVQYLFATCAGVSKVGSYTGTGTTLQIDCGFTGGARFVLIKRTDSTGDWYVWDSARGIVSGNDPYLLLNSTAAEVTNTDYVDTYSAGFEISSTAPAAINASGGTFIFLAIA